MSQEIAQLKARIKKLGSQLATEAFTIKKYPELDRIAKDMAYDIAVLINKKAKPIKSEMPYKAQYILEELIKELEERV